MPALNCTVILLLFFIACIYTLSLFLYSSILDYLLNPITIFFETIEKLGHGHCIYRGVTGYQILGGQLVKRRAGAFYSAKIAHPPVTPMSKALLISGRLGEV